MLQRNSGRSPRLDGLGGNRTAGPVARVTRIGSGHPGRRTNHRSPRSLVRGTPSPSCRRVRNRSAGFPAANQRSLDRSVPGNALSVSSRPQAASANASHNPTPSARQCEKRRFHGFAHCAHSWHGREQSTPTSVRRGPEQPRCGVHNRSAPGAEVRRSLAVRVHAVWLVGPLVMPQNGQTGRLGAQ